MLFAGVESTCAYLWLFAAVLGLGWAASTRHNSEVAEVTRSRRSFSDPGSTSCMVPRQPRNGRWKLHRGSCDGGEDCDIPQGIMLASGSQLVYRCDPEYEIQGNPDVYCEAGGTWSAIPSCISNYLSAESSEYDEIILTEFESIYEEECDICGDSISYIIRILCLTMTPPPVTETTPPPVTETTPPPVTETMPPPVTETTPPPVTETTPPPTPVTEMMPPPKCNCTVPPQPEFGHRRLHETYCDGDEDCEVAEGTSLPPGSWLVYTCLGTFLLRGPRDVYCQDNEQWTTIPNCTYTGPTCAPSRSAQTTSRIAT